MRKKIFYLLSMSILLFANQGYAQYVNTYPTINTDLRNCVHSILEDNIRKIDAINGQVIIMDCKSGEIKAMMNLVNDESGIKSTTSQLSQPTGLMRPISLLAALEQDKVNLNDSIDTKEGVIDINGYSLHDHNWRRGGYGKLTIKDGLLYSSAIATYLMCKQSFGKDYQRYFDIISKIGYGLPDEASAVLPMPTDDISFAKFVNGENLKISSLQLLTFYNAIANNGKMVQPTFTKGDTIILKEQIASKENIAALQQLLVLKVKDGLAQKAYSNKVSIAGEQGKAIISGRGDNAIYCLQFCGYYPAENPQYSIIVTLNKQGLPASGGMAGEVLKQIVEMKY
jgi:cell division protein FtsI (penicillin-binding protein 3)